MSPPDPSHADPASPAPAEGDTPHRYNAALAATIERRWQDHWDAAGTFHTPNPAGPLGEPERVAGRPKLFVLDMFPYPSGTGLHVGHPLGYIGTDVYARYQRMSGHNVLHALGYDAFGLPAEQFAIRTGQHPRVTTDENIATMRRQLRRLGLGHDPRRSVSTTDPEFYRWTQWIFLQIFNSYYDPDAGRARPIADLVAAFESGDEPTPDGRPWSEMTETERRQLIDDRRLAYSSLSPVNWCPGMGTVLANEEVTAEGRSDIGNFPVFRKEMRQWMMRITAYADRLLADLDRLDWPEPIKAMQRNWIGRSEGAYISFPVVGEESTSVEVFTTRPDTIYGATFLVISPEHPLVDALTTPDRKDAVAAYVEDARQRSDRDRQADTRTKTGVPLGSSVRRPVDGREIPLYIADYVLMGYGTGAVMGVPAQDERDWDFAVAFGLDIVRTVQPPPGWEGGAYVGDGEAINSGILNGLGVAAAKETITAWLEENGAGRRAVTYRLRDWLFSRQRYWGEPFPIVWDDHGPLALNESDLPVLLPEIDDFEPAQLDPDDLSTEPILPLGRAPGWATVTADLGAGPREYRRELNVMPQWAGSCWYEIRYLDPTNDQAFVDPEVERYWLGPDPGRPDDPGGVDLYVGGVEHAVLHLLYARFWHKVLFDLGHVSSQEPFRRLFNQGYIQAYAFKDRRGQYVEASEVVESDGAYYLGDEEVSREYGKMGKSLKNMVTPDDMYDTYGADTLRLYEMAMGPLEASRPWATRDVVGMHRFLQRLWRLYVDETTGDLRVVSGDADEDTLRLLHQTIAGVAADYDGLRFNTAIAKLIEFCNHLTKRGAPLDVGVAETLALLVAPLVPHLAEELWSRLGHTESLAEEGFPAPLDRYLVVDSVEIPVQVNGKVRLRLSVPVDADASALDHLVRGDPQVADLVGGREIRRLIVVPGRLVNIVL